MILIPQATDENTRRNGWVLRLEDVLVLARAMYLYAVLAADISFAGAPVADDTLIAAADRDHNRQQQRQAERMPF